MQGGVRKRGKTWSYYFYLGVIDGKKKMKEKGGFKKKEEAQAALRIALMEFENGGFVPPKSTTFMEFAQEWLNEYVKPLRKISTYNRYKELIKIYLNDIGLMKIDEITSYHIEQLLLKNKHNVSGATLQSIYTLINTIMNRALKLKLIKDNPCKYVERPKRDKITYETLEISEIEKIFSVLDTSNYYDYMFYIALTIGLTPSFWTKPNKFLNFLRFRPLFEY